MGSSVGVGWKCPGNFGLATDQPDGDQATTPLTGSCAIHREHSKHTSSKLPYTDT